MTERGQKPKPRHLGRAARTLAYYIKMACEKSGAPLQGDCLNELNGAVEDFERADAMLQAREKTS